MEIKAALSIKLRKAVAFHRKAYFISSSKLQCHIRYYADHHVRQFESFRSANFVGPNMGLDLLLFRISKICSNALLGCVKSFRKMAFTYCQIGVRFDFFQSYSV